MNIYRIINNNKIRLLAVVYLLLSLFLSGCNKEQASNRFESIDLKEYDNKVIIALIDTGVAREAVNSDYLLTGYNYIDESADTEDTINHGTAIASIILGSKKADIKANTTGVYVVPLVVVQSIDGEIRQLDANSLAEVIRDSVDVFNADVINISLGVTKGSDKLKSAVDYAKEKGVVVVAAAGNKEDESYYPASYDSVISVGSVDKNGRISSFSPDNADEYALGEDIWMASRNGNRFAEKGTSFATAFISAKEANKIEQP